MLRTGIKRVTFCLILLSPLSYAAPSANGPAGYACRITNGAGQVVEIANCLPSCETQMTEACCNEIFRLGTEQGLGFKALEANGRPWAPNFRASGKAACAFSSRGLIGRDGAIAANASGAVHVVFNGAPRKACDGGATLDKGTMVHFQCTNVASQMTNGVIASSTLSDPPAPTSGCTMSVKRDAAAPTTANTTFFHIPRGISDAATSVTGNATLTSAELAGLAKDLEGPSSIGGQINGYDPSKQYFKVEVKGQASCGVKGSPAHHYCDNKKNQYDPQFQQDLATRRGEFAIAQYPTYLQRYHGWSLAPLGAPAAKPAVTPSARPGAIASGRPSAGAPAAPITPSAVPVGVRMTKTVGGKVVTIVIVKAAPEVKMCNTAAECKKVQGVTSLVFKRNNGS